MQLTCILYASDILTLTLFGEQRGMEDPRGLLFSELVRLLRCCQPKALSLTLTLTLTLTSQVFSQNPMLPGSIPRGDVSKNIDI